MSYLGSRDATITATGVDMAAGETKEYTFPYTCAVAWVTIIPTCAATIYGKWNAEDAGVGDADFILSAAGIHVAKNEGSRTEGVMTKTVSLYCAAGAVLNTDFFVKGFRDNG